MSSTLSPCALEAGPSSSGPGGPRVRRVGPRVRIRDALRAAGSALAIRRDRPLPAQPHGRSDQRSRRRRGANAPFYKPAPRRIATSSPRSLTSRLRAPRGIHGFEPKQHGVCSARDACSRGLPSRSVRPSERIRGTARPGAAARRKSRGDTHRRRNRRFEPRPARRPPARREGGRAARAPRRSPCSREPARTQPPVPAQSSRSRGARRRRSRPAPTPPRPE